MATIRFQEIHILYFARLLIIFFHYISERIKLFDITMYNN